MAVEAILFDMDGTLIDGNSLHALAWQEAPSSVGLRIDRRRIHDQISRGTDMPVPALMAPTSEGRHLSVPPFIHAG